MQKFPRGSVAAPCSTHLKEPQHSQLEAHVAPHTDLTGSTGICSLVQGRFVCTSACVRALPALLQQACR